MAGSRSPQGIGLQVLGDDSGVQRALEVLDSALNPIGIASFLGAVVDPYLRGRAKERFTVEGDDVTGAWVPLSTATQTIRASEGYGAAHPINRRTGELERYITQSDNQIQIMPTIGAELTLPGSAPIGKLEDKVKVAQQGDPSFGRSGTPARPVLGMNEQDLAFVLLALAVHVKRVGGLR